MTFTTWARPSRDVPFCAVVTVASGSVQTHCRGRWSTSDTVEMHNDPRHPGKRCGGCLVALGLAELAAAPAVDMRGTVEIDFSDVDVDCGLKRRKSAHNQESP